MIKRVREREVHLLFNSRLLNAILISEEFVYLRMPKKLGNKIVLIY